MNSLQKTNEHEIEKVTSFFIFITNYRTNRFVFIKMTFNRIIIQNTFNYNTHTVTTTIYLILVYTNAVLVHIIIIKYSHDYTLLIMAPCFESIQFVIGINSISDFVKTNIDAY